MKKKSNPKKNLRSVIKDLDKYTPGSSTDEIAKKYKLNQKKIIKLGSNENVLGPSPKALKVLKRSIEGVNIYPEVTSDSLREKIKKLNKVRNTDVFIGNGMDHVFEMLVRLFIDKGDETIISTPTFSCYKLSTLWAGGKPKYVPLTKDYQLNVDKILKSITKKTKIIFICSPNNPSGNLINKSDIKKILESTDRIVFLDEAYIEYSGQSLVKWIDKYPNLIIGRTFSKIYGLAGLRVGYAFIHKSLSESYINAITPFTVTKLGQIAALTALDDNVFIKKSLSLINKGKEQYYKSLDKLGIEYIKTDANFISINTKPFKASEISEDLLKEGVIVRDCARFGKGGEHLLRITIGTEEQNKRVIKLLSAKFAQN